MTIDEPKFAWQNGVIVRWGDCVLHARSQCAFWGANVFEGVRAYWSPQCQSLRCHRLDDHLRRLRASMKALDLLILWSDAELRQAIDDLLLKNAFNSDVHIVIVAYFGFGNNFDPLGLTRDTGVHITAVPAARSPFYETGAKVGFSTWRRIGDDTMPPRIKTGANYHNSRLAHHEAVRHGYDTALLINQRGTVSEGPGSCVLMLSGDTLITPPGFCSVLESITVSDVAQLGVEHLNLKFERRELDRTELYFASELMLCGTLAEVVPILALDGKMIGNGERGVVTRQLQSLYDDHVRGDVDAARRSMAV